MATEITQSGRLALLTKYEITRYKTYICYRPIHHHPLTCGSHCLYCFTGN
ncbi:hypothetical protein CRENPOLYSF2_100039 [Crenothrix polyspora]|uniref:Uncharacterized protein n=1 Tax=Crenothrix polyspora TaxID=360316 RepID=A0A1R4GYL2_9GAMM|nr:hypothetical protein CRENPOLYSF2_100039 [Crenothrix polyspora]